MRNAAIVKQARDLAKEGWSAPAIANKLFTKPDYVSRWLKTLHPNKRVTGIKNHHHRRRMRYFSMDRVSLVKLSCRDAKMLAGLLYWCEGSKYPASACLSFTSSDPEMQKVFISLLRKAFVLDESRFRVWLQIHDTHDREEIFNFWSKLLNIPVEQFIKPKVTKMHGLKYRNVYYGTCSVRYSDYSIILRLMGIYRRLCGQILRLSSC